MFKAFIFTSLASFAYSAAQLGATCNTNQPCEGTLVCYRPNPISAYPGIGGYCVYPLSKQGGACGGTATPSYQHRCDRGLYCKYTSTLPGATGTCTPYPTQPASGYVHTGGRCSTNHPCAPNDTCGHGICRRVKHGVGEHCGGGTRYAFQCQPRYSCLLPADKVGALGYCLDVVFIK